MDKHAPLCLRSVVHKTRVPWFTDEIRSIRRLRTQSEHKWKRTKLDSDWKAFKALRNRTTYVTNKARHEFYSDFVNKLFAITKKMFKQVKESHFPEHCNQLTLTNELGAFLKKKISDICFESDAVATVHNNHSTLAPSTNCFQPSSSSGFLSNFEVLSKDSIKKLVLRVQKKSCSLDALAKI